MSPGPRVFVHLGAMKTGTTYLQQVLAQNKQVLREHGYLFPGRTWDDQVRAAHDVLGHHRDRDVRRRASGAWPTLLAEMLGFTGTASVLSVEFLSFAGPRAARRVLAGLAGAEVHLVLTVRDTAEVLPGLWQTHCANGGTASWPGFARSVRLGSGAGPLAPALGQGARLFRRALDVPRILDSWGRVVPPERLHVVTVPASGAPREMLWQRFAGAVGIDPDTATAPARGHNPSLGYGSADLLRRLNRELGRLPRERYNPTLKHVLAEQVLAPRAGQEERARLDAATRDLALRWNRRTRRALEASGAHLVGDLEDLPVTAAAHPRVAAADAVPDQTALLDAAATAVVGMERLVRRRRRRLRAQQLEPGPDPRQVAERRHPVSSDELRARWQEAADPVAVAVGELADLCRVAIADHDRLRRAHGPGSAVAQA